MQEDWYRESFLYHAYPLGMLGAPEINDYNGTRINKIEQLGNWVSYWKELGINTLFLGPVCESNSHGYDIVDYYSIDRRLGSNDDFKVLCSMLHNAGIRVLLDGVFHHVGKDFFAFKDVQHRLQESPYRDWFCIDFTRPSSTESFSYECWEGHSNLVKLNLQNHELREYLFNAVRHWITDYGISGLRLDVAYALDHRFIKDLRLVCKAMRQDFVLMGEVIHGDYNTWLRTDELDSVTNYECYKGLYSSHNDRNYFEIAYSLDRQFGDRGLYRQKPLYNFADNHDVNRVASQLKQEKHLYLLYILLMTMPGVPSVYYGSELGIHGRRTACQDRELRPALRHQDALTLSQDSALFQHIRKLAEIRRNSRPLLYGDYRQLCVHNEHFAFSRTCGDEEYLILVNLSDHEIHSDIRAVKCEGRYIDLLNNGETYCHMQSTAGIPVFRWWGRILKRITD